MLYFASYSPHTLLGNKERWNFCQFLVAFSFFWAGFVLAGRLLFPFPFTGKSVGIVVVEHFHWGQCSFARVIFSVLVFVISSLVESGVK